MRRALIAGMILMLAGGVQEATACTCIPPAPPLPSLEEAAAVFVGDVLSIRTVRGDAYPAVLRVTLRVQRSFKGDLEETVEVRTARDEASCGFPFKKGESYIVYSHADGSRLHAGLCSRTARLQDAQEDLDAFDALDLLTERERSTGGLCGGPTIAVLQGMFFILLGLGWKQHLWFV